MNVTPGRIVLLNGGLVDYVAYVVIDWPGWGTAMTVRPSMPSKSAGLQV